MTLENLLAYFNPPQYIFGFGNLSYLNNTIKIRDVDGTIYSKPRYIEFLAIRDDILYFYPEPTRDSSQYGKFNRPLAELVSVDIKDAFVTFTFTDTVIGVDCKNKNQDHIQLDREIIKLKPETYHKLNKISQEKEQTINQTIVDILDNL